MKACNILLLTMCIFNKITTLPSQERMTFLNDMIFSKTPLHKAVENCDFKTVQTLLENESDVSDINAKDSFGETPLHKAARYRCSKVIETLLNANADFNDTTKVGETALLIAVQNNDSDFVLKLLSAGVDVTSEDYQTILHEAAKVSDPEIMRELIRVGADIHLIKYRPDPIWNAIKTNAEKNITITPLHIAARYGNHETAKALLSSGMIKVDVVNQNGNTPLHFAAYYGSTENTQTLEVLLNARANINAINKDGNTPLHYAAKTKNYAKVEKLLHRGARTDIKNAEGKTALQLASGNAKIIRMIAKAAEVERSKKKDLISRIRTKTSEAMESMQDYITEHTQ